MLSLRSRASLRCRSLLPVAGLLVGCWLTPSTSLAQALGSEFQVNTTTASDQRDPRIAMATAGFVVVWADSQADGSSYGVFGQRYDSSGTRVGNEFQVNTYTTAQQAFPAVAANAEGDFMVVWSSYGQDGSFDSVAARRYASNGSPVGSDFVVNTYTTELQGFPDVAATGNGTFVVVWQTTQYPTDAFGGVFGQRYDSSGNRLGTEFHVNTYTGLVQGRPSVAARSSGEFVVVWDGAGATDSSGVFGQRFDASGIPVGSEFQVNTYTTDDQFTPRVAMNSNGDFVVVWNSANILYPGQGQDGSSTGVFGQSFASDGTRRGSEFQVNTYTADAQFQPAVKWRSNSEFVVVWTSLNQDGADYGVFGQRFATDGTKVGTEFQVNTFTTDKQDTPDVASYGNGDFLVAWNGRGNQDGAGIGVFASVVQPSPSPSPTTTTLTSAPNPSTFGQAVTFTATVSPSSATGTVTFSDGGAPIGSGTLSNGSASVSSSALSAGNHSITGSYAGSASFAGSTSSANTQVVNTASTTTALVSSANPVAPGQTVTFTATVSAVAPGAGVPGGTVAFSDGGAPIASCSAVTLAFGQAQCSTSYSGSLSSPRSITATYVGSASFQGSTSSVLSLSISRALTTTALASTPNPSTVGQVVLFTATVSPSTAAGLVTFVDVTGVATGNVTGPSGVTLGNASLSGGIAVVNVSSLPLGSRAVQAQYAGDAGHVASFGSLTQVVQAGLSSTTTLASSKNPSRLGEAVVFTATVSPSSASGTVTFKDRGTTIGSGALGGGVALFNTSTLSAGAHSMTAEYPGSSGGNTSITGSTSAVLTQVVKGAVADFNGDGRSDVLWRKVRNGDADSGWSYAWLMSGASLLSSSYTARAADFDWEVQGVGDFDGDGKADILWRNVRPTSPDFGRTYVWFMDGTAVVSGAYTNAKADSCGSATSASRDCWEVQGLADFDGDGKADILWRNMSTVATDSGSTYVWLMDGASVLGRGYTSRNSGLGWAIQAFGDFDGDGKADVLWRNLSRTDKDAGLTYIWLMDGATATSAGYQNLTTSFDFEVQDVGDFNRDGKTDILWRNVSTTAADAGGTYLWMMDGLNAFRGTSADFVPPLGIVNRDWEVQGVGDFDGDGYPDILWRSLTTTGGGGTYLWRLTWDPAKGPLVIDRRDTVPQADLAWELQAPRGR